MKKLTFVFVLSLFSMVMYGQNFDERLLEKYTTAELSEMERNSPEEFEFVNLCLTKGFYIANYSSEKATKGGKPTDEIAGEVVIDDIENINFFELNITPVSNRNQYFKIKGIDKLLVIRAKELIKK